MNEKIIAALKDIYLILDVSAVYAPIFKRYNKHKWRKDESSHNHNHNRCYIQGRERRGEKHRETLRWGSREQRERSSIRVRDQVSFQAFWEDQKRHRMGGSIESKFIGSNDQRLFDQKAIDVAVTPHDTEILPVHLVTGTFFVFCDRRGVIDVLRSSSSLRRVVGLSIFVCVGHRGGQCCCPISYSRRSS